MVLVEICTDNYQDTVTAIQLGADRIELCSHLEYDGLTPSQEFLSQAVELARLHKVTVFPMIRCRPGNFVYSDEEKNNMIETACEFARAGVPGIVTGALTHSGELDMDYIERFACKVKDIAPRIEITFHKAIDLVELHNEETMSDMFDRLSPFCSRVLTSGGFPNALAGAQVLRELAARTGGPMPLIAGKIRNDNVLEVMSLTGAKEVHSRSPLICAALGKKCRVL